MTYSFSVVNRVIEQLLAPFFILQFSCVIRNPSVIYLYRLLLLLVLLLVLLLLLLSRLEDLFLVDDLLLEDLLLEDRLLVLCLRLLLDLEGRLLDVDLDLHLFLCFFFGFSFVGDVPKKSAHMKATIKMIK